MSAVRDSLGVIWKGTEEVGINLYSKDYDHAVTIIIRGKTSCSLCSRVLATGEDIVGFSHFLEREHPLWQYSDSSMHRSCYAAWPDHVPFGPLHQ